jgi:tRNA modification GTPase
VAAAFDGWPVELVDTAGVRATEDALERSGVERTLRQTETADLVLQVLDQSELLRDEDRALLAGVTSVPTLIVVNKADLEPLWRPSESILEGKSAVVVSAERGDGLDALIAVVVQALVQDPPEDGAGVPFRAEYLEFLRDAAMALRVPDGEQAVAAIARIRR